MDMFCDLHTHSHYSDGTFSPAAILAQAEGLGLSAVALTDHNTVAGLPEFLAAAQSSPVTAVPGVEISTGWQSRELHIVGLDLQPEYWQEAADFLAVINRRKEESNRALVRRLCRAGFVLDYDAICRSHTGGTVNRAVIAAALLEKGYVSSISDAFQQLLSRKAGFFIPPERIRTRDAIAFLRRCHAVPVLAHPLLSLNSLELRRFLPEARKQGLLAMETLYATFSPEETAAAKILAREFSLMESGGSDFHGGTKPDIQLGTGLGNLQVPGILADRLLEREESVWHGI